MKVRNLSLVSEKTTRQGNTVMTRKTFGNHFVALVAFAVIASTSSAGFGALVHRYSFDTDASDSVGSADGTLTAGATVSGGQLVMDGADEWVDLSGAAVDIAGKSAVTIEYWGTVAAPNSTAFFAAFGFGEEGAGTGSNYLMQQPNRAGGNRAMITSVGFSDEAFVGSSAITDTLEHHFAVTVDSTTLTFYVDGASVGSTAIGIHGLDDIGTTHARIGHGVFTGDPDYLGSINEFRIYDMALSASEVAASFAAGANPVPTPTALPAGLTLIGLAVMRRRRA